MAYMNQEKKQKIAAALKPIMPKDWKWSLSVRDHMSIVLTIAAAPVDLMAECMRVANARKRYEGDGMDKKPTHIQVNNHHPDLHFDESLPLFEKIIAALNTDNHDRSDLMTDYFDVGHYVDIDLGRGNKPFAFTGTVSA